MINKKQSIAQLLAERQGTKSYKVPKVRKPPKPKNKSICPFCGSKKSKKRIGTMFRKCSDCEKLFITPNTFFKKS